MTSLSAPYHHGDLRNALLAAGLKLIEQVGVEAFSLREVARAVGVSANAAYRHFEDKGALLTAIAVHGFERLSTAMADEMASARPKGGRSKGVARLFAAGRAYVELAQAQPQLYGLMFGAAGRACFAAEDALAGPTPGELLGVVLDELVDEAVVSKAQRAGAELRAWSAVHGFASLTQSGPMAALNPRARAAALEGLLEFVLAGLQG